MGLRLLQRRELVSSLLEEEIRAGFIQEVPGGVSQLQAEHSRTGIGRLAVIIIEGKPPRLVVDSSISNVTAHTMLPNQVSLPRISDVMACSPASNSLEEMIALTLDVSKAHRRIQIHPADQF